MDNQKVKRVARILIILWILFIGYFYEFTDTRTLFEYIGFLLVGLYLSVEIKSDWKYLLIIALVWNVADEAAIVFVNESCKLLTLIPVIVYAVRKMWKHATNYELTIKDYDLVD